MEKQEKITKYCLSCGKDGHTYLECKKMPFVEMVKEAFGLAFELPKTDSLRSCIHCGNKDQSKFDVWEELDYNDGADEPHTGGNYLVNVEYGTCLVCGENI